MSVINCLLVASWTALASIAGTIHERFLPIPTQPQRVRASPSQIHSLQVPAWQSQSFSWSYGSILLSSLSYIVLSTRGCSPRRPAAVMITNGHQNQSFARVFKGLQESTGHCNKCGALPSIQSYLLAIRFHSVRSLTRKKISSQGSCWGLRVQLCYRKSEPKYPPSSSRILTWYPFDIWSIIGHFEMEFLLGSTNPCPTAVQEGPFSTLVFKVLIWIFFLLPPRSALEVFSPRLTAKASPWPPCPPPRQSSAIYSDGWV